jgi:hypothetical protein
VDSDWYSFVIERFRDDLALKNVKTGYYITNDYKGYYYLMNETGTGHPRRIRIFSSSKDVYIVQSAFPGYPDYLTYFSSVHKGVSYLAAMSDITNKYVANINFISVSQLKAKIFSFKYDIPNNERIESQTAKLNLISPTYLINNSTSKITHEINDKMVLTESIKWNFDKNIDFIDSVSIDKVLPSIVKSNGGFEKIKSSLQYKSEDGIRNDTLVNEREYSVMKKVEMQPYTWLLVEASVENVEDLKIPFKAIAEMTGEDESGPLTGDQLLSIVNENLDENPTIIDVSKNSVSFEVNGDVVGTFSLNNKFSITTIS